MPGYLYMLECADGSYYVGSTRDLYTRLAQHQAGGGAEFTKRRRPVRLVYVAEFPTAAEAFGREKQIQGWGRRKRRALALGDFDLLSGLARRGCRLPSDSPDDEPLPTVVLGDD